MLEAGTTILLVEDDILLALGQKKHLEQQGCQVVLAANGAEALSACSEHHIDLVLMDINIGPGMNGFQAARALLNAHNLPIIFLSSYTDSATIEQANSITPYGFIPKNSSPIIVSSMIRMALQLHKLSVETKNASQNLADTEGISLDHFREIDHLIAEKISDVIWILDLTDQVFRYISPSVQGLRGFSPQEILDQRMDEALDPSSLANLQKKLPARLEEFQKGERRFYLDELAQPHKNGSLVWTETTTSFQINPANGHLEVVGVSRNITERKHLEATNRLRLELLEKSVNQSLAEFMQTALDIITAFMDSPIGFYHFVERDQVTISLQAWSTHTLNEYCHAEGKGMHYPIDQAGVWADCVRFRLPIRHNDYQALPNRRGLPEGHAELIRELVVPVYREDHVVAILGLGNKPVDYTEGDVEVITYLADVIWEITERKKSEEKVRTLLQEKEILLKEVHHRVKNNMNTIASLLQIQRSVQSSPEVSKAFLDAESRVQSMMILYDRLYRADNLRAISIRDYFPPLIRQIVNLFPNGGKVKTQIDLPDLTLPPNILYPLGIILNELTTNSLKYAFGATTEPTITISAVLESGRITIYFGDNGPGLPESFSVDENRGFGMQLIELLARQIDANVIIENTNRAQFAIQFSIGRPSHNHSE